MSTIPLEYRGKKKIDGRTIRHSMQDEAWSTFRSVTITTEYFDEDEKVQMLQDLVGRIGEYIEELTVNSFTRSGREVSTMGAIVSGFASTNAHRLQKLGFNGAFPQDEGHWSTTLPLNPSDCANTI